MTGSAGVLARAMPPRAPRRALQLPLRIAGKLLEAAVILWLVSVLVFFATQAMHGDVATVILGVNATPERLDAQRSG